MPLRRTVRVAKMRCGNAAFMQIQTDGGLFSLAIPRAGRWDCSAALEQWRKGAPTDTAIGLRYTESGGCGPLKPPGTTRARL